MDKINSNVIDFSPAGGPSGPSVGQVYIDLDGTLKRGIFAGQSAASFEAVRQSNRERYAASGFVQFGKHVSDGYWKEVNQGIWVSGTESSKTIHLGTKTSNATGSSKTELPQVNIAGVIFSDLLFNEEVGKPWSNVKFPPAPDGKTTYHKTKGEVKVHVDTAAAFIYANQSDNIEVVTDRVDMWGFEAYLEEVTTTKPFVYPNGLIQSQAYTMNGISTSASNRPVTYYSVFEGDTGSKGKGLDVTKLSYVQLATILGDHKHNLYYLADGRLVQWRLRQRTIAGAGNGDWAKLDSNGVGGDILYILYTRKSFSRPLAQGKTTNTKPLGEYTVGSAYLGNQHGGRAKNQDVGCLSATSSAVSDIAGECYFLVCGTVNRLNQGFYHPSLNANGSVADNTGKFWYNTSLSFTNQASCFDLGKISYD